MSDAHSPAPIRQAVETLDERAGLVLRDEGYGDGATRLVYLDQGWRPSESLWFYFADQGSVLMPYDTFLHLEQPDTDQPFLQPEHLSRFRVLPQRKTPNNPDALPVGFARHGDQLGLTCAACHTAQINYRGTAMRIDGAPTLADSVGLFGEMDAAMKATLADDAKLARFAATTSAGSLDAARASLSATERYFASFLGANHSSTVEGFARMDAIDRIINQLIRFTSGPENSIEPNAPNCAPFLWDAPRHDYVQWGGFSPNADGGALGRNTGEVIGVFGQVQVKHYETEAAAKRGYPSSIQGMELVRMEDALWKLESPVWPEDILPPIDRALAARGERLYQAQCQSCHAVIDRADPHRKVVAMVTGVDVVGTDPQSVKNLVSSRAPTGILQGAISPTGETYGAEVPVLALLLDLGTRTLSAQPVAAAAAVANAKLHGLEKTAKQGNHPQPTSQDPTADLLSYKARPLDGIWATAPYLHNGSVPTLHDLLLPAAARPRTFSIGRREYDPRKVGYASDGEVPFTLDTSVTGNSNRGHEYGTTLSDADRAALLEYLKTL
jgi:mono/diheme cytochrome c family protein